MGIALALHDYMLDASEPRGLSPRLETRDYLAIPAEGINPSARYLLNCLTIFNASATCSAAAICELKMSWTIPSLSIT